MAPVISLFGIEIPSYTLMVLLGFGAGFLWCAFQYRRYHLSTDVFVASYLIAGVGAFFGGKIFYAAQGFPQFLELHAQTGLSFLDYFMQGGLVFYGGMAGTLLCILLDAKVFTVPKWDLMDCLLPALPLAQAFGRVGCFLVGCCYGMPSSFGFCMDASAIAPHGIRLLPVQLIESACCIALFLALAHLSKKARPAGFLLGIYLAGYGSARFILEFFRYDRVRGIIGPFSVSQWISMFCIGCAAFLFWQSRKRHVMPQNSPQDRLLKY